MARLGTEAEAAKRDARSKLQVVLEELNVPDADLLASRLTEAQVYAFSREFETALKAVTLSLPRLTLLLNVLVEDAKEEVREWSYDLIEFIKLANTAFEATGAEPWPVPSIRPDGRLKTVDLTSFDGASGESGSMPSSTLGTTGRARLSIVR